MGKKSNAQINRMKQRAAARGEEYIEPPESVERRKKARMFSAAVTLRKQLSSIEQNGTLKAKERRSAKRKAEAIASEEAGCLVEELLEWYDKNQAKIDKRTTKRDGQSNKEPDDQIPAKRRKESVDLGEQGSVHNPYIVFVGQLAFTTSRESLFQHFQSELGKEHTVTKETLRIRLLTDPETKKSRGMAFVETNDPEILYSCLRLHHTQLDGRRINVERSAGGKRTSDARKSKISQYRKEQEQHMSETVEKMLADYKSSGDLGDNVLDGGVVTLCKRHSATTVEAALGEFVEARGCDMENPSAYLTFLIRRIAAEGVIDQKVAKFGDKKNQGDGVGRRPAKTSEQRKKREQPSDGIDTSHGVMGRKLRKQSEFSRAGVDMSISESDGDRLSKVFPSISRGRGRGRGYM